MMQRLRKTLGAFGLGAFVTFLLMSVYAWATTITWSHTFADGEVLTASMLETMKTNITDVINVGGGPVNISGTQTISGDKTFSGTNIHSGSASFTGTFSATGSTLTLGNAVTDSLTVGAGLQGANPLIFDGATDNTNEMTVVAADFSADRNFTLPDADVDLTGIGNAGDIVQIVTTETASVISCSTTGTTYDNTIPAITDGVQILSRTITPTNSSNLLYFFISGHMGNNSGAETTVHLHKDGAAAVAATAINVPNSSQNFILTHSEAAGSTSSQTWTVRVNPSAGGNTNYVNGDNGGTQLFGGVSSTKITIMEVKV